MVEQHRRFKLWLSFLNRTGLTVPTLTALVIILTQSVKVVYFAAGAVMCAFTVKLLKRAIRQPRPPNQTSQHKTTYGMPSTHSATISYYATYIHMACMYLPLHESFASSPGSRLLPSIVSLLWAASVVMSRVWLGYHTLPQVTAGVAYGVAFAIGWFRLVDRYGAQLGIE